MLKFFAPKRAAPLTRASNVSPVSISPHTPPPEHLNLPQFLLLSGHRHENLCLYTQLNARIKPPLSMVAGTGAYDVAGAFLGRERLHLVVSPAYLGNERTIWRSSLSGRQSRRIPATDCGFFCNGVGSSIPPKVLSAVIISLRTGIYLFVFFHVLSLLACIPR